MEEKTRPLQKEMCQTLLGATCIVEGDVATKENVFVRGTLHGNVITVGTVTVCGAVEGDVTCAEFTMDSGSLQGNLQCQGAVRLSPGSCITGNVQAGEFVLGGKLRGNAAVASLTELTPTAAMQGDLSAGRLKMADGAALCGSLAVSTQKE